MNKSEIAEIKKQFAPDRCTIDRICGCYVNYEKKKIFTGSAAFGTVPDEEMFKYLDLFRHVLSGKKGKNLIDLSFPIEAEDEGSPHDLLMRLRESALTDEVLLDMFYDRVIEAYDFPENYYIVLIHAVYDVPGVSTDGFVMADASDNVYEYLLCALCPVVLSKAALGYNEKKNLIEDRFRDFIVEMPVKGFLFPAFHDRTNDIHAMLYYTKKPEDVQPEMMEALFGAEEVLSAPAQREGFQEVVRKTVGENGDFETVRMIHENLNRMIEEHDSAEPLTLDKKQVKQLLSVSGVEQGRLRSFSKNFDESFHRDDYPLLADNIASTNRFELTGPDVKIYVHPSRSDRVTTRIIDGKPCLVIEIDDRIEVNGVLVKPLPAKG